MRPEVFAIAHFVQLRDAHAVSVRLNMLGVDIHSDFREIEVRADTCRGCDARACQHVADDCVGKLPRGHAVGFQVIRRVDKHLVDRIDMNVLGCEILQIDAVNLRADLHIARHARLGDDKIHIHRGIVIEKILEVRASRELALGRFGKPQGVDLFELLVHLEQPCPARNTVRLE